MTVGHGGPGRAPRLYGLVVTYRRSEQLGPALEGIDSQSRNLDKLVVVDNSPTEITRAIVEEHGRRGCPTEYLPSEENLGPAGGTALAMEHLLTDAQDDDWLIRVDDDRPPPDPDLFADLEDFARRCLEEDPRTGAVGLVGARYSWTRGRLLRVSESELHGKVPVDYLATNHFPMFRVAAIRDVGPFDPQLFFGSSEVEYGLRLRRGGYQIYAHGDRWLTMRPDRTDPLRPRSRVTEPNWRRYYSLRNQIHVLRSAGHTKTALRVIVVRGLLKPIVNLPLAPRLAVNNLRLNVRAIRDGWSGRLGRTLEPDDAALDRVDGSS